MRWRWARTTSRHRPDDAEPRQRRCRLEPDRCLLDPPATIVLFRRPPGIESRLAARNCPVKQHVRLEPYADERGMFQLVENDDCQIGEDDGATTMGWRRGRSA